MLLAYRLGEAAKVRLPVIVNLDGFYLSYTREPVDIPDAAAAADFVGDFDPGTHQVPRQPAVEPGRRRVKRQSLLLLPL